MSLANATSFASNGIVELFETAGDLVGMPSLLAAGASSFVLGVFVSMISGFISRTLSSTYRRLPLRDQHRWNAGINRAFHGILLWILGTIVLLEGLPEGGAVTGTSPLLLHTAAFSLGFFVFETRDSVTMYLAHNVQEEALIVHHMLGIALYFLTLSTQSYLYIACMVLVQELHAPFTHIGWILAKQGRDNTILWDINQYVLIFVWVVFREGCDLLVWIHIIANLPYGFLGGPFIPLAFILVGAIVLTAYLNPWWLKLKIQQFDRRNQKYRRSSPRAPRLQTVSRHERGNGANASAASSSMAPLPSYAVDGDAQSVHQRKTASTINVQDAQAAAANPAPSSTRTTTGPVHEHGIN
eukprot:m.166568 g.166568  ORF g.166568 m.166568 type:complete len:355 (+) comp14442_c1_seq3:53-1117(+)